MSKYVTRFEEIVTGKQLFRSTKVMENIVIPEGIRPFPDRNAVYKKMELIPVEEWETPKERMFKEAEKYEDSDIQSSPDIKEEA